MFYGSVWRLLLGRCPSVEKASVVVENGVVQQTVTVYGLCEKQYAVRQCLA